ncbi:non-heme iron oxygenase ferredoxin subunit [Arcanobacterium sp. S3PF19]|uniref:non-heme iron oxygenase ferredoxin subunit n=1 Tax=Arcanobacterium sp. S3PF19 TaxID=1219585 RepID=UPI00050F83C4|nr:non-heme iron oxygenase ferredoxin subunit [Arcanobacterium sp. S3PF19]KGF06409.1 hypothetical protein HMPREF1631_01215 [Arcanobacterium sp. S3PF19]
MLKELCPVDAVATGEAARFEFASAAGNAIAIALVHSESGNWYALEDRCSHGRFKLSDGFVDEETIECTRHGAVFDLATGDPRTLPATKPVKTYPTHVRSGSVFVELDAD